MIGILGLSDRTIPACRELWGTPNDPLKYKLDLVFEMHERSQSHDLQGRGYWARLKDFDVPIVMQHIYDDVPMSEVYPRSQIAKLGADYFTCTAAYMIAYAVYVNEPFGLYGFDLSDPRYEHQRPCIEFWLGVAIGRGLGIDLPDSSPFLKAKTYGLDA